MLELYKVLSICQLQLSATLLTLPKKNMPKFYSTYCGQHIEASEDLAGAHSICPSCRKEIDVPNIQLDHKQDPLSESPVPPPSPNVPETPTNSETNIGGKILSLVGSGFFFLVVVFLSRSCGGFIGKQAAERELSNKSSEQNVLRTNDSTAPNIDFELILPEIVTRMNKSMPITVDRDTRINRVSSGPGRKFTYHYSMTRLRMSDFDRNEMISGLRKQLIEGYKNQADLKYFKNNNVTLDYSYVDVDGNHFATISITPEDADSLSTAAEIDAQLDRESVPAGNGAILTLSVSGGRAAQPKMPAVKNFIIEPRGRSQQMQIANGKTTVTVIYKYVVGSNTSGDYQIPSIDVTIDDRKYSTKPLKLKVLDSSATQPPAGIPTNLPDQ